MIRCLVEFTIVEEKLDWIIELIALQPIDPLVMQLIEYFITAGPDTCCKLLPTSFFTFLTYQGTHFTCVFLDLAHLLYLKATMDRPPLRKTAYIAKLCKATHKMIRLTRLPENEREYLLRNHPLASSNNIMVVPTLLFMHLIKRAAMTTKLSGFLISPDWPAQPLTFPPKNPFLKSVSTHDRATFKRLIEAIRKECPTDQFLIDAFARRRFIGFPASAEELHHPAMSQGISMVRAALNIPDDGGFGGVGLNWHPTQPPSSFHAPEGPHAVLKALLMMALNDAREEAKVPEEAKEEEEEQEQEQQQEQQPPEQAPEPPAAEVEKPHTNHRYALRRDRQKPDKYSPF